MFASKTLSSVVLTMVQSPSKSGIALSTSSYVFKRCFPPFTFREQIPLEFKVLYKQKKFISWKKITKRSEQEEKIWAIQFIRVSMNKHIICIFKYKFE